MSSTEKEKGGLLAKPSTQSSRRSNSEQIPSDDDTDDDGLGVTNDPQNTNPNSTNPLNKIMQKNPSYSPLQNPAKPTENKQRKTMYFLCGLLWCLIIITFILLMIYHWDIFGVITAEDETTPTTDAPFIVTDAPIIIIDPTVSPTHIPTMSTLSPSAPSLSPTALPSLAPSINPTLFPSKYPTQIPSISPSFNPSVTPTHYPTLTPSLTPSLIPSRSPSLFPTKYPTSSPTHLPTETPSLSPTKTPTNFPSEYPTLLPTKTPSTIPTKHPTFSPSKHPTNVPTKYPTGFPTHFPTKTPSNIPTKYPSNFPTEIPTNSPSQTPTSFPTKTPTNFPSEYPTLLPSTIPTKSPTFSPSKHPTQPPTHFPSETPTKFPFKSPTLLPTNSPTKFPTFSPSEYPTRFPSEIPTNPPSETPTNLPSKSPTLLPTFIPTFPPTNIPTHTPTPFPSHFPTETPTHIPTNHPTHSPSHNTGTPSKQPTQNPTNPPTLPSQSPSQTPTVASISPSASPTQSPITMIWRTGNTIYDQGIIMDFPPNAFPDSRLDITIGPAPQNLRQIFDETTSAFEAQSIATFTRNYIYFEVENDPFTNNPNMQYETIIPIPAELIQNCPSDYGFEIFTLVTQTEYGGGTMDMFVLFESEFDASEQTLTTELIPQMFTNKEAFIILSCTPGTNILPTRRRNLLQNPNWRSECKAAEIICPIENGQCNTLNPYSKGAHHSVDYETNTDTNIISVANGAVEAISHTSSVYDGNVILIRNEDGSAVLYGNLGDIVVSVGEIIAVGRIIAVGSDTHMHFEYIPNGEIYEDKARIDANDCFPPPLPPHMAPTQRPTQSPLVPPKTHSPVTSPTLAPVQLVYGSITVMDSGALADDAFAVYIDGWKLCETETGALNTCAINNIRPGRHTLTLEVIEAPDGFGTWYVELSDGWMFVDGTTSKDVIEDWDTLIPQEGWEGSFDFIVPPHTTSNALAALQP